MFSDPVFVLSPFEKRINIVLTGKEVKGHCTENKSRFWCSLTRNDRCKDGCKTSVGKFIRDSSNSERDVERRRRLGKCQVRDG